MPIAQFLEQLFEWSRFCLQKMLLYYRIADLEGFFARNRYY